MSNSSAISWREQFTFQWNDDVRFVLDQHDELDLYSASSLKQQSVCKYDVALEHIILIPSQSLFALARNMNCFDTTDARTHDLPYCRWER